MESKVYVFEGKTTNEAIEKGLKELKVTKSKVDIKVLENEEKRSFFSILTPRVVKVEMTLKETKEHKEVKKEKKTSSPKEIKSKEEINKTLDNFMKDFLNNLPTKNLEYDMKFENDTFFININGKDTGYLIGYRGEVLNNLQSILCSIASKNSNEKVRVILNIGDFRERRVKDLEILADKISKTVIKTKKPITLEPMSAYERKIIHTKLQSSDSVKTYSIGEEPYRKVVVELK